jgi:hypothetical protein
LLTDLRRHLVESQLAELRRLGHARDIELLFADGYCPAIKVTAKAIRYMTYLRMLCSATIAARTLAAYVDASRRSANPSEDRNIAGRHTKSQHAYGNAVDIDSTGRNIITPDFAAWVRTHDKELHEAESRWGIRAGRDWCNPDMGHWEWGGGAGSGEASRRQTFGHQHRGHHLATIGRAEKPVVVEDHTGGMVTVVPQ